MRTTLRRLVGACALLVAVGLVGPTTESGPARAQSGPVPNPPIADSCGTDVVLVLDASGSISSSGAVDDVRDAAEAFLDALADTGSTARVTQFGSISEELAGRVEVTTGELAPGGSLADALRDYYNPKPPRPPGVQIRSYRGGNRDPQSASSWRSSNGSNQYTNWDQSLRQASEDSSELVVYVTDGDPSAYDFDQPGDPFDAGPPPDVGVGTDKGRAEALTLDRAVEEADVFKGAGTRMLAIGVGAALNNPQSQARLEAISGPQVVRDADLPTIDSINDVDVALVQEFDELAAFLRGVVSELCSPSLSIRKLAQTADSAAYAPAPSWDITVTPSVSGGTYEWILPDTDPVQAPLCGSPANPNDGAPRTCATDASGLANFQWEPDPSDADTSATVVETPRAGYTIGRPADPDWTCRLKNIDGTEETASGELGDGGVTNGFRLDVEAEQIITCNIYNSFDYAPDIDIAKVNSPSIVRGDLPEADREVTSTYTVTTATGNTPLSGVTVTDALGPDRTCAPVTFTGGDTDGDGLLDPGENWTFDCTTPIGGPSGNYVNTARVVGTAPNQVQVAATATDDVDVVTPAIELDKVASSASPAAGPADFIEVPEGTDVTYTFTATNTGDTELDGVTLTDPNCDGGTIAPTVVDDLAPGASTLFTCSTADVVGDVVNTATVSGTPDIPGYVGPNPDVTDVDTAEVRTFDAAIQLTKSVDRSVIFPDTAVVYTYEVQLPAGATVSLLPTDAAGTSVPRLNWVVDPLCTSPEYQSGDDGDEVLEDGEVWVYTCGRTIPESLVNVPEANAVVNVADVHAVPQPTPGGPVVNDDAAAVVFLIVPEVDVVKTASRSTVLDPPATCPPSTLPCAPLLGPDAPTPRTVDYTFDVSNPGVIPLDLTDGSSLPPDPTDARITDTVGGAPGCTPTYVGGDTNGDGYLDIDEVWTFECTDVALTKAEATNGFDVVNTVDVTATGILPGPTRGPDVTATDTARVQVLTPNLSLTKTPSETLVRPGTPVTYTYEVTNTGDPVGLDVLDVVDDRCSPVAFVSGDDQPPAGNGLLDVGETWVYQCTEVLDSPDDPGTPGVENEIVNEAIVGAVGPLGNLYVRDATATVQVFDPRIDLVKDVDDSFVPVGTEVTYTFTVTNTGDDVSLDDLTDILLADASAPPQPSCENPTIIDQGDGDDILSVGEVWRYTCSAVIGTATLNLAAVSGTDIADGLVVDIDAAYVEVYEAGIDIVKSADPTVLDEPGGPVTYSYEVTNTGNVPLADVESRVIDDTCSPVTLVSGDDDGNDLLTGAVDLFETGPPETWTFECTTDVARDTTNVVTVDGTPVRPGPGTPEVLGPDVSATDTAFVEVVPTTTTTTTIPTSSTAPILPPQPTTTLTPGLPETGGDPGPSVRTAILLIVVGAGLALFARRRTRTS